MVTLREEAGRLLAAVQAERDLPTAERSTHASDGDLERVKRLLQQAAGAETPSAREMLRGQIAHLVVDSWSYDAALSSELIQFDNRFLAR